MLPLNLHPERICIFRLSALGDATHVVPVVRAIRDYWPQTKITWIIGKLEHRLLSGLDDVEFAYVDVDRQPELTRRLARGKTIPQLIRFEKKEGKSSSEMGIFG